MLKQKIRNAAAGYFLLRASDDRLYLLYNRREAIKYAKKLRGIVLDLESGSIIENFERR